MLWVYEMYFYGVVVVYLYCVWFVWLVVVGLCGVVELVGGWGVGNLVCYF